MSIKFSQLSTESNVSSATLVPIVDPAGPTNYITTLGNINTYLAGNLYSLTTSLKFAATGGGNYIGFQAPASIASNVTWTLPGADATTAGFALVSNGAGVLSWAAAGAAIATDVTDTVLYPTMTTLTTGNFTAAKVNTNLTYNGNTSVLSVKGSVSIAGSSSGSVTLTVPANAGSTTYTLPSADATSPGYALVSNGSGALSWAAAGATITTDSSSSTLYPVFTGLTSGSLTTARINTSIVYNASTNVLTVTNPSITTSLNTSSTTFALVNTTATTVNAFGSATTINMGAVTGTTTVNNNLIVTGNLTVNGTTTTVNQQTINTNVVVTNGLAVNGSYTGYYSDGILIDYVSGTPNGNGRISVGTADNITFYNGTDVSRIQLLQITTAGNLTMTGGTLVSSAAIANVFNTTSTTVNAFGAGTAITVGASTGTVTINNPTVVGSQTTQNLYNTVATTLNFGGAATAINVGASTGTVTINNPTVNVASSSGVYQINGGTVLSSSTLGTTVLTSSLTTVGTIGTGVWQGTIIGVTYGGLGISTTPANGQIPIGNGTTYSAATITAGQSMYVTNGAGSITIATDPAYFLSFMMG